MVPEYSIIGGGIAGLILFKELKKLNKTAVIYESNDNDLNYGYINTNSLNHQDLHTHRNRGIGGTSIRWGGGCTMFEPEDFNNWPFDYDNFKKYYDMAAELFKINNKQDNNYIFNKKFISNKFIVSNNVSTKLTRLILLKNYLIHQN